MPHRVIRSDFILALICLFGVGCAKPSTPQASTEAADLPVRVAVVNHPIEYFARRIGGDLVDVVFPIPEGIDPAFWQPGRDEIMLYQDADLILRNGASYARWMDLATLRDSRTVNTGRSFSDRLIEMEGTVTHHHGPTGEHTHGELASTTWLDPTLAFAQSRSVLEALIKARPDDEERMRAAFDALETDLVSLDRAWKEAFAGSGPLLGSHPVYQYLAARYDLDLRSVHFEPNAEPDDAAWAELEALLAEHPARVMLWEGEPLASTVDRLRSMGVASVVVDPCANRSRDGDWLTVMRANVERVRALRAPDP